MVTTLNIVLLILIGGPLVYLAFLSLLGIFARSAVVKPAAARRRFAVVVPAHDEEAVIGDTLRSLNSLDYPRDRFDVVVIADNCSDRTADIARENGAVVLVRSTTDRRSKGHALRWGFDLLLPRGYDGVVVCDADTVASSNLLIAVDDAMTSGAAAIQCADLVRPNPGSWSSEATRAGFLLYNVARPLGRRVLGCSAGLRGNGMAFTAETLLRVPWQAYSRAEDLEFGLILLLHGIQVQFVPEATVHATMPADAKNAESQRARWEGGRLPIIRRYGLRLLGEALRQRSYPLLDAWIDLVTPAFVNLVLLAGFCWMSAVGAWIAGVEGTLPVLWSGVLAAAVLHVVLGFVAAGAFPELLRLVRHVPRYVVWKLRLYTRLALSGETSGWVRTTRETPEGTR